MMIASTAIALVAVILCDSVFARPQFIIKTPANEFILRSCIASAQLSRKNRNKDILSPDEPIKISTSGQSHHLRVPSVLSSDAPEEHSQIIKINAIPYQGRHKFGASGDKLHPAISDKMQHHSAEDEPISDTPLKTVRVQPIRENGPIVFKEKNRLPHLAHDVSYGSERKSATIDDKTERKMQHHSAQKEPLLDTPLKTVRVLPVRENGPIVFKEKNRLPHLAHNVSNGSERKKATVFVIKPSN